MIDTVKQNIYTYSYNTILFLYDCKKIIDSFNFIFKYTYEF